MTILKYEFIPNFSIFMIKVFQVNPHFWGVWGKMGCTIIIDISLLVLIASYDCDLQSVLVRDKMLI